MSTTTEDIICRICVNKILKSLSCDLYSSENEGIRSKLKACADIKIDVTDGLPQFVCVNCIDRLEAAYDFRQECEASDAKLRQQLLDYIKSIPIMDITYTAELQPASITSMDTCFPPKQEVPEHTPSPEFGDSIEIISTKLEEAKYHCDNCAAQFNEFAELLEHLPTHTEVVAEQTPSDEQCNSCVRCLRYFPDLSKHICTKTKLFTCTACNKSYSEKSNLRRHVREMHLNIRHVCDICGREFSQRGTVKLHRQIVHNEECNFQCIICDKRFKALVYLRRHRKKTACGGSGSEALNTQINSVAGLPN